MQRLLVIFSRFGQQSGSINQRIFAALLTIGFWTFAAKALAFAKDLVVASTFGVGDDLDAYFQALVLPLYLMNIVTNGFSAALTPAYIQAVETEGRASAARLFSSFLTVSLVLLVGASLLLIPLGRPLVQLISGNFPAAKQDLTLQLFLIMLPMVILQGLSAIWMAILNSEDQFALPTISRVFMPLTQIVALLVAFQMGGVLALAAGLSVGFGIQTVFLAWLIWRAKLPVLPRWYGMTESLRGALQQYAPMLAGATILSSTVVIDQAFAANLDAGSVAALNFGNKVIAIVLTISTTAIATAVLPYFSRAIAQNDWQQVRHTLRTYSALTVGIALLVTIGVVALSEPLVRVLLQRGAFDAADTAVVTRIQTMYALQIPWVAVGVLFVRLFSAMRLNQVLLWGNVISFVANIVFNWWFIRWLGVEGIALATAVVMFISCIYLGVMLTINLRRVGQ